MSTHRFLNFVWNYSYIALHFHTILVLLLMGSFFVLISFHFVFVLISVLSLALFTDVSEDSIISDIVYWTLVKTAPHQTDLPREGKAQLIGLIIAFHKGRCHLTSFPLRAKKSAQSIFLQISEHACHSFLCLLHLSMKYFIEKYVNILTVPFFSDCFADYTRVSIWNGKEKQAEISLCSICH